MATIKEALSASTALTITLDSLASSQTAGRASTAVDNTVNLYLDALVQVKIVAGSTTPANDKAVYVYSYASVDGTNYTESVTGTDAAFTRNDPTNLSLLGVIPIPTASTTYWSKPMSVAAAHGGILPVKWGIVVVNFCGGTLSTGNSAVYSGLTATVV